MERDGMTATGRLRELLDERGVEWREHRYNGRSVTTLWRALGSEWHFRESEYKHIRSRLIVDSLTPEQAVEAALGRGTCANANDPMESGALCFRCSECGAVHSDPMPNFCSSCGREVAG